MIGIPDPVSGQVREMTEKEKLEQAARMAKAMSAQPKPPAGWAATTEWPGRHKATGDRRVHATAQFTVGTRSWWWPACGKPPGDRSYQMPRESAVDCRGCRAKLEAGQ